MGQGLAEMQASLRSDGRAIGETSIGHLVARAVAHRFSGRSRRVIQQTSFPGFVRNCSAIFRKSPSLFLRINSAAQTP